MFLRVAPVLPCEIDALIRAHAEHLGWQWETPSLSSFVTDAGLLREAEAEPVTLFVFSALVR